MDLRVGTWLGHYVAATPGTNAGHKTTSFIEDETSQPDSHLIIRPEYGGHTWQEGKYLAGARELIAEVCRSSAANDLHVKYDLYEAAGVAEYLAILLYQQEIRWHIHVNGKYELMPPGADGIWRSRVFPGLWLDGKAPLGDDLGQVLACLDAGIKSAEHEAFVSELRQRRRVADAPMVV